MGYDIEFRLSDAEPSAGVALQRELAALQQRLSPDAEGPPFVLSDHASYLLVTLPRSRIREIGPEFARIARRHGFELWDPQTRTSSTTVGAFDWDTIGERQDRVLGALVEELHHADPTSDAREAVNRLRKRLGALPAEDVPPSVSPPFFVTGFVLPVVADASDEQWEQTRQLALSKSVIDRRRAAVTLGGWPQNSRVTEALLRLIEDPDPFVRGGAAQSLGLIGAEEAYARVVGAWRDLRTRPESNSHIPRGARLEPATMAALGAVILAQKGDLGGRAQLRHELEALRSDVEGADLRRVESLLAVLR